MATKMGDAGFLSRHPVPVGGSVTVKEPAPVPAIPVDNGAGSATPSVYVLTEEEKQQFSAGTLKGSKVMP